MSECAHALAAPPSSVAGPRAVRNSLPRQGFTSLRSPSSFSTVYRNGIRHRKGPLLVLQTVGVEGHTRVGFVAGRKVGNAVQRNRAKRRLREAVRRVHLPAGHDFVVVASPECTTVPFDVLVASITNAVEANTMKLGSAPR